MPDNLQKIYPGALLGWVMDAFDLSMMFLLVPTIADLFFPPHTPYAIAGTLSIYFISLVFRPLGGAIFGHLGDKIGRKPSMFITLLGLGLSMFITGLLPTYYQIGVSAIALLILLRILVGIFAGGEYGNSASIVVENASSDKKGLWSGLIQIGYPIGYTLAALTFLSLHYIFPGQEFLQIGWRYMFYIGLIPAIIGLLVRLTMPESSLWLSEKEHGKLSKSPIKDLFKSRGTTLGYIIGMLAMTGIAWLYSLTLGFYPTLLSYHSFMKFPYFVYVVIAGILTSLVGYLTSGWASDKLGRENVMFIFAILSVVLSVPLSHFIISRIGGVIGVGIWASLLAFITTGIYGVIPVYLSEKFPTKVRSTGIGFSFNSGFILGSWSSVFLLLATSLTSPMFYLFMGIFIIIGEMFIIISAILSKIYRTVLSH